MEFPAGRRFPLRLFEMQDRRDAIIEKGYPFLVGEIGDQVVGYAYAGPYRSRSGYRYTIEHSIYVDKTYRHNGTGASLMKELICRCGGVRFSADDCGHRGLRQSELN